MFSHLATVQHLEEKNTALSNFQKLCIWQNNQSDSIIFKKRMFIYEMEHIFKQRLMMFVASRELKSRNSKHFTNREITTNAQA